MMQVVLNQKGSAKESSICIIKQCKNEILLSLWRHLYMHLVKTENSQKKKTSIFRLNSIRNNLGSIRFSKTKTFLFQSQLKKKIKILLSYIPNSIQMLKANVND